MLSARKIGDWDLDLANDTATPCASGDRVDVQRQFAQALTGEREWHFESRVIWPDASVHWMEAHCTVFNDGTVPQRMVGIVVDITERKNAAAALQQADPRNNEFLATLAHELRNPLAPIALAASVLQSGRHLDQPRLTQTGQIIERQIRHMTGLNEGLLDVSRVTRAMVALSSESLDFRTVFAHAAEQAQPLFDRKKHRFTAPSLASPATPTAWSRYLPACWSMPPKSRPTVATSSPPQRRALRDSPATAACRLIAVTGYAGSGDRERALAAGFDEYLVKPVDPDKLAALLGQA